MSDSGRVSFIMVDSKVDFYYTIKVKKSYETSRHSTATQYTGYIGNSQMYSLAIIFKISY